LLSWKFHGCILRQDFHPQYVPVEYVHTIKAYNPVKESHCAWQTPRKHKSGGYRNWKKWTCRTCLTRFGREAKNWTFLPFQSRHVMTRCKNGHIFHPTWFYTAQHNIRFNNNYFEVHRLHSRPPNNLLPFR
jgi:hypothetical protein